MQDLRALFPLLLKQLRSGLSQKQLSKKLDCSEMNISRWERGVRACGWADFLKLCLLRKKDLGMALHNILGYRDSVTDVQMLLHRATTGLTLSDLAARVHKPVSTLHRWLEGKTEPNALEVFSVLNAIFPGFFWGLIWNLCPESDADLWGEEYVIYKGFSDFRLKYPFFTILIVYVGVYSGSIKNSPQLVLDCSSALKSSKVHVKDCLDKCFQIGLLPVHTPRSAYLQQILTYISPDFTIKNGEITFYNSLISKHIFDKKDLTQKGTGHFYSVVGVSESARQKITDLRISFMNQCRELFQADKSNEKAHLLLLTVNTFYFDL